MAASKDCDGPDMNWCQDVLLVVPDVWGIKDSGKLRKCKAYQTLINLPSS